MTDMTLEHRQVVTRATMSILDSWKLGIEEMQVLMGLPQSVRARSFQKYRSHEPFPDDPAVQRRADYVMRIAGALHTTSPTNSNMGWRWLRQRNRRFGRSPLAVLMEGGEDGLIAVLAELDCTFSWDQSGSKPA
jgi:hypothetical protein